jgi:hypothetical protein
MRYNDQINRLELEKLNDSDLIGFAVVRDVAKIEVYDFIFRGVRYPTLKVFPISISKALREEIIDSLMADNINYQDEDWLG